jgi:hypothetical protein
MRIIIKNQPQVQQIRTKQSPEIARDIVLATARLSEKVKTLNVSDKSDIKAISVVKGVFNGMNNDIPVNFAYVDSNGDMVKISNLSNGTKLIEIEPCEATLEYEAKLYDNVSDDEKTSTGVTRQRIKLDSNLVDLCLVSLGFYRNYLQSLDIKGERKTHQDENNKTIYQTLIKCKQEDIEKTTKLIKSFNKPNMIVEWY